jgi:predicted nucleic acid-binding protein
LGRELAARGHQLPLSDLVLVAFALDRDYAVWTSDPHFDLIPDLKRYNSD